MLLSNTLLFGSMFLVFFKSMNKIVVTRIANANGNPLMVDVPKSGLALSPFLQIKVQYHKTFKERKNGTYS